MMGQCCQRPPLHICLVFILLIIVHFGEASSSSSSDILPPPKTAVVHPGHRKQKIVIGIDGGTESIRACCFDANNGRVIGKSFASAYKTTHPQPGWAEQNPHDWWNNLGEAVRGALDSLPETTTSTSDVVALCVDTTCCSLVALDSSGTPLRHALLWMDARSAPQTAQIMEQCRGDPALLINSGGHGPISAEWMIPKCLWLQQNEQQQTWKKASIICEYQDFINFKLTGLICASSCNAAARWHWDGHECIKDPHHYGNYTGRPMSLYQKLGITSLADKLPSKCLPMGSIVGTLTKHAAKHLGLKEGLTVAQGGPDAFVGMIGLGCIHPGQLCLITGSSHLHCVVTSRPDTAPGIWGAYKGAPLPGINFAEGGQSSTGSIIRWAKDILSGDALVGSQGLDYKTLDKEADAISPGSDGLIALETFQGSRTPITDPLARGVLLGLTLSHTRSHIWRALMEAVCFGTKACVDGLASAGHSCSEIIIAGGATRSPLWLQMHADVTAKPVVLCENTDAPLLGCAVLASVAAGVHDTVEDAVNAMVRPVQRIEPRPDISAQYEQIYNQVYSKLSPAIRPLVHSIANLRGGGGGGGGGGGLREGRKKLSIKELVHARQDQTNTSLVVNGPIQKRIRQRNNLFSRLRGGGYGDSNAPPKSSNGKDGTNSLVVSPSLLASDWTEMKKEIQRCADADVCHLHLDVFDGVFLDSPMAFTFGPLMVKAIRRCCSDCMTLDIHLCVDRPTRFVEAMAEAGADRIIFQWEAMEEDNRLESALDLAKRIRQNHMECGISINPTTNVEVIYPLMESGLVDMIDVLAVEPGFGGQKFQHSALTKLRQIRTWRENRLALFGQRDLSSVRVMIDGGINERTGPLATEAGADVLVVGTFLFQHPISISAGVKELLQQQ